MLSALGGLPSLSLLVHAVVALTAFAILASRPAFAFNRRGVRMAIIAWALLITVEFWVLGPISFIYPGDDGETALPFYRYLARGHDGGSYAHAFAGGGDALGMVGGGTAYVSLEVLLFQLLPMWGAVGVHKILVVAVAAATAYRLGRFGFKAARTDALALALVYSVAHRYLPTMSLSHGLGFALIPLAIEILAFRVDRSNFWAWLVPFAAVHATSFTPTISGLALAAGVGFSSIALGLPRPGRFTLGVAVLVAGAVANWHEALFALAQNSAFSYRSFREFGAESSSLVTKLTWFFMAQPMYIPLAGAIVLLLARFRPRLWWQMIAVLITSLIIGQLMIDIPWPHLGLGLLKSIDFNYATYAFPVLLVMAGALAASAIQPSAGRTWARRLLPAPLAFALAIGQAAALKVGNFAQLLGTGGLSTHSQIENLAVRAWAPIHTFRVATLPYRLEPSAMTAYGFEAADGVANLLPRNRVFYWIHGIRREALGFGSGRLNVTSHRIADFLCCRDYDARSVLSLDALKVLNVEFVISQLPLTGGGLDLVSGPPPGTVPPRRDDPMGAKIAGFLELLFHPADAYVYRLPGALPRAFAATGVDAYASSGPATEAYYDDLIPKALASRAVVAADQVEPLRRALDPNNPGRIVSVERVRDGYDLVLDMPAGGVAVINATWTPFWRAYGAGKALPAVESNAVHMAVPIPQGTRHLALRYERPLLRERLVSWLLGPAGTMPGAHGAGAIPP